MEATKIDIENLVLTLERVASTEFKKENIRLEEDTLRNLHEHVGQDKFLKLVDGVALYSNKGGHSFVQLVRLRKALS